MADDKKKEVIILPDGTRLTREELEAMDDTHYWEAPKKKTVLGQKKK